jgi:hypothetical protein
MKRAVSEHNALRPTQVSSNRNLVIRIKFSPPLKFGVDFGTSHRQHRRFLCKENSLGSRGGSRLLLALVFAYESHP